MRKPLAKLEHGKLPTLSITANTTEPSQPKHLSQEQKKQISLTADIIESTQKNRANDEMFRVKAMEQASKSMSECLKQKENLNSSWLLYHLAALCASKEETPQQHQFQFENSRKAAKFNTKLIKYTDYDVTKCIHKQKNTVLTPGSEFRSIEKIRKLLRYHEDWPEIRDIISKGCDYKLGPSPDEETRMTDLTAMLERGNHKSAKDNIKTLNKAFTKEVEKGWLLPVTVESLRKIKSLSIIPLGIAEQSTIDEFGNKKEKKRVTHDASYPAPSGTSVNNLVIEALLQECIYGQSLRRILHGIHDMRWKNKNKRIFMTKYDMDAAYRRLHALPEHALKCVTVIDRVGYIPLRLPFGVSPGPSIYSSISECIYDLVNDLLNEQSWNRTTLNSPYTNRLAPPEHSDPSIPIEGVRELAVYLPNRASFADGYIDDCLTVALDQKEEVQRSQEALPLIVHALFRPLDADEPVKRNDNISDDKLKGEGQPSERRVMLGWLIDTIQMRVYLPVTKALAWSTDIKNLLSKNKVTKKELESTVGRLNHVGYIIPMGRYFLNRLRHLLMRCDRYGSQQMQNWEQEDLKLWLKILETASMTGVSTNNIVQTKITSHVITDACEYGLGGFNILTCEAWRYKLPKWMTTAFHINLLEFIASFIAIWLDILKDDNKTQYKKYMALTDNSSAVGWLYKSNFNPKTHPGHDVVARKMAEVLMESESTIESQHIKGAHNVVADSLSRDHHIHRTHLELILTSLYPTQAPPNLKISEILPPEITCWLDSLKATMTNSGVLMPKQSHSKTGTLFAGRNSSRDVVSTINSLKGIARRKETKSCQLFSPVLDEMKMAKEENLTSKGTQSHLPSIMYVRHFGRTFGGTRQ